MAVIEDTPIRDLPAVDAGPALPLGTVVVPPPPAGRLARRRWLRELQATASGHEGPTLVGTVEPGVELVVLDWPGANGRFRNLVGSLHRGWARRTTVVGTADRGARPSDVVDSNGAAALSRQLQEELGVRPEWEVQHGKTHSHAALRYLADHRPGLVAVPRPSGGPRAHRQALELAVRANTAIILA